MRRSQQLGSRRKALRDRKAGSQHAPTGSNSQWIDSQRSRSEDFPAPTPVEQVVLVPPTKVLVELVRARAPEVVILIQNRETPHSLEIVPFSPAAFPVVDVVGLRAYPAEEGYILLTEPPPYIEGLLRTIGKQNPERARP